ncbi:hypothetical protein KSS87_018691 [Heliosperma pusillum]|nr:hypothetical protein KSS87_018691 [Heliosperma pusillum]
MAKVSIISKDDLATKLVQEISQSSAIPDKFLLKNGFPEAIDAHNIWNNKLLIDYSLLSSSSMPTSIAELAKLRSALCDWGCFLVVNHGIERRYLEEIMEVVTEFFGQPLEEKHKYATTTDDFFQGYGNDRAYHEIPTAAGWNDRLYLRIHPLHKRDFRFWPQNPHKLRGMLEEFTKHVIRMNEVIYKAMAKCMNVEEDCFLTSQGNQEEITARLSFYPRCPCPDQVQGFQRHADATTISINLSNTEGLEVLNNDQWYKVPVIPGALFVNIGHLGEVMSNGVFKSAVHRVITNSEKERTSVVAFCQPEKADEIGPVNEFVKANQPQKFRSFNFDTEYKANYLNDYVLGRSPLEAFKL